MKFTTENKGMKFYFNDQDESAGSVTLRLITKEKLDEVLKRTQQLIYRSRRGVREEQLKEDIPLQNRLIWDYQIEDWEKVELDGKPVDPTPENKYLMMTKVPQFLNFVLDGLEYLRAKEIGEEELEKNLGKPSNVSTKESKQDSPVISANK